MHSLRMTPVTAKSYLSLTCVNVSVNPAGRTMMVTGWHGWHAVADPITAIDIGWLCSDPFQPSLLGECAVGHSGIWQGGGSMCEKAGVNISRYLMLGLERVTTMTSHQWNIFCWELQKGWWHQLRTMGEMDRSSTTIIRLYVFKGFFNLYFHQLDWCDITRR